MLLGVGERAVGGEGGKERKLETQARWWRIMTPFVTWFNDLPPSGLAVACHPLPGAP